MEKGQEENSIESGIMQRQYNTSSAQNTTIRFHHRISASSCFPPLGKCWFSLVNLLLIKTLGLRTTTTVHLMATSSGWLLPCPHDLFFSPACSSTDAFPRIIPIRAPEAVHSQPAQHLQCPLYRPDSSSFAASLRELEKVSVFKCTKYLFWNTCFHSEYMVMFSNLFSTQHNALDTGWQQFSRVSGEGCFPRDARNWTWNHVHAVVVPLSCSHTWWGLIHTEGIVLGKDWTEWIAAPWTVFCAVYVPCLCCILRKVKPRGNGCSYMAQSANISVQGIYYGFVNKNGTEQ